jgi:hypothetical protein
MVALLGLVLAAPAAGHDDAALDARAAPHGGQLRMAGPYHYELVVGEGQVTVYLTDHADRPVASEGVRGQAIVLSAGKTTVPLTPAGGNVLQGTGAFAVGADMKVVVSATFADGSTWQVRFTPGQKSQAPQSEAPSPATPVTGGHVH